MLHLTLLHIKYISFVSCGCTEDFFMYFHYKSMVENDMPWAWHVWVPGAPLAGFIKRRIIHCSTQNMKAMDHVVLEKICLLYFFPIASVCELLTTRGGAYFKPRGIISRIYVNNNVAYQIQKLWLL